MATNRLYRKGCETSLSSSTHYGASLQPSVSVAWAGLLPYLSVCPRPNSNRVKHKLTGQTQIKRAQICSQKLMQPQIKESGSELFQVCQHILPVFPAVPRPHSILAHGLPGEKPNNSPLLKSFQLTVCAPMDSTSKKTAWHQLSIHKSSSFRNASSHEGLPC
jgi:hypothetical protein